ncbi:MAG: hypothetical protein N3B21_11845, partial [Clostridia bacterium]|nr:hypothetical protein [Clostridia bacterium]
CKLFVCKLAIHSRILKLFLLPMQRFLNGLAVLFTIVVRGIPGKLELKNLSVGGSIPPLL